MYKRRMVWVMLLITVLALSFWTSSRYPALQGKADAAGVIQLEDFLTHEAHLEVSQEMSFYEKVGRSTVNWVFTNKKGMIFAIFMAPAFLVLFGYLSYKSPQNRVLSSLYGMGIGTPLGVCVNCVAPISKAIYEGSKNTQLALAVMFSSPGLNIVVLTMLFSLFPWYVAALKLAGTFFLILVVVPLISKEKRSYVSLPAAPMPVQDTIPPNASEGWVGAGIAAFETYIKAWVYIVLRTVPLMFVAGFLGALFSHLWDPSWLQAGDAGIGVLFLISLIGTFLPMPIAVDIMLAHAFMTSHIPMSVVGVLLFTLGIFSIYSFFIVWRTFSLRLALLLYIIVAALGTLIGVIGGHYQEYEYQQWLEHYDEKLSPNE